MSLIQMSTPADLGLQAALAAAPVANAPLLAPTYQTASSLVFVDAAVGGYASLVADLDPTVEVHVLNPAGDEIDQITQVLAGRSGIASLSIVSHGAAGSLQLGATALSAQNLNNYAADLQAWGTALTADADILLYGCNVGAGDLGYGFVQQLAGLTGADIAASNDLTGNAALGGDWNLEVNVGKITAATPFKANVLQDYGGLLAAPVLDTSGNPILNAINANDVNSAGTTVTDLIARLGGTGITDADGDPKAIAITNLDNTNGTWQYSTNGGTTWANFGTVSNTAARLLGPISLYTAGRGGSVRSQGWLEYGGIDQANPLAGAVDTQTLNANGTTTINTTAKNSLYAGYSNITGALSLPANPQQFNPAFPTLDNAKGYSLSFDLQSLAETHTDVNRAGFSVIVLGSDHRGIELGFQVTGNTGNIFAQRGTTTATTVQPANYFVADENVTFNVQQAASYTVTIQGDSYTLLANGTQILTGALRDYAGYVPISQPLAPIDPYTIPNTIFLGDDTSRASANFTLSRVTLQTNTRLRFVPNTNYSGTATVTFKAWDTSDGSANGATANTTGAAFSTASETATLTVNPTTTPTPTPQKHSFWSRVWQSQYGSRSW